MKTIQLAASFGSIDPAALIVASVGVVLAIPGAIVAAQQLREKRAGQQPSRAKTVTAALLLVVALVGFGTAALINFGTNVSACTSSRAVALSGERVGDNVNMALTVGEDVPDSCQYILIAQPRDEDVDPKNHHAAYFLSWRQGRPKAGTYQHSVSAQNIKPGEVITYYFISVDDTTLTQLEADLMPGNFVLKLPDGVQYVSNRLPIGPAPTPTAIPEPPTSSPPPAPNGVEVAFTAPGEGSPIHHGSDVQLGGTVTGLAGKSLWLISHPQAGRSKIYTTGDSPITSSDGQWSYTDTEVGDQSDIGTTIEYAPVAADESCSKALADAPPELNALPKGCTELSPKRHVFVKD
jgi:hypothetical protein